MFPNHRHHRSKVPICLFDAIHSSLWLIINFLILVYDWLFLSFFVILFEWVWFVGLLLRPLSILFCFCGFGLGWFILVLVWNVYGIPVALDVRLLNLFVHNRVWAVDFFFIVSRLLYWPLVLVWWVLVLAYFLQLFLYWLEHWHLRSRATLNRGRVYLFVVVALSSLDHRLRNCASFLFFLSIIEVSQRSLRIRALHCFCMLFDLSDWHWNTSIRLRLSFIFFNFDVAATIRNELVALFWMYSSSLRSLLLLALPLSSRCCSCHGLLHEHLLLLLDSLIVFWEVLRCLFTFFVTPLIAAISTSVALCAVAIISCISFLVVVIDVVASNIGINLSQEVRVRIYHEFRKLTWGLDWTITLWLCLVIVGFLGHQRLHWKRKRTCWVELCWCWESIRWIMLVHSIAFLLHSFVVLNIFDSCVDLVFMSKDVSCRSTWIKVVGVPLMLKMVW